MNDESQFVTDILVSVERQAKIKERLAILEILIEEMRWVNTPLEIELLDRIQASIKHRTHEGL